MSPDLAKLIALQEIDIKIISIKTRLATIPAERDRLETSFKHFSSEYNDLRERLETAQKERARLQKELEETQKHHEKYKEDLMKVRNEKEYTTCLREIDVTKKQASQLETELLQVMEQIEKLEKELQTFAPEVESRRKILEEQIAVIDRDLADGQKNIDTVMTERENVIVDLPKPLLARYERIAKLRNGQALAQVKDYSCMACHIKIRPQVYNDIKRGNQVIDCEICSRILYYRAPEAVAASES